MPGEVEYDGHLWLPRALDLAKAKGIEDRLIKVATQFRSGIRRGLLVGPDPLNTRMIRVEQDDIAVVLSPDDVILGFVIGRDQLRSTRVKSKGKGGRSGPTTYAELRTMLRVEGYTVVFNRGGTHPKVIDREGRVVYTLSGTPSSQSTLDNEVAGLRRALGIALRR